MDYRKYNTLRMEHYRKVFELLEEKDMEVLGRLFERIWKKGTYYCNNFNDKTAKEVGPDTIYNDLKDAGIVIHIGEDCYTVAQEYIQMIVDKLGLMEKH